MGVLNANSSKMAKDYYALKIWHACPRDSPDKTLKEFFFLIGRGRCHVIHRLNVGVLTANASKMAKDMPLKFGMHAPWTVSLHRKTEGRPYREAELLYVDVKHNLCLVFMLVTRLYHPEVTGISLPA